jgi:hypothetical protein
MTKISPARAPWSASGLWVVTTKLMPREEAPHVVDDAQSATRGAGAGRSRRGARGPHICLEHVAADGLVELALALTQRAIMSTSHPAVLRYPSLSDSSRTRPKSPCSTYTTSSSPAVMSFTSSARWSAATTARQRSPAGVEDAVPPGACARSRWTRRSSFRSQSCATTRAPPGVRRACGARPPRRVRGCAVRLAERVAAAHPVGHHPGRFSARRLADGLDLLGALAAANDDLTAPRRRA